MNLQLISIYITCTDEDEATKLSWILLEQELIACANYFPIDSSYWWRGRIETEGEYVIIAKSIEDRWGSIVEMVQNEHSYETPCIVKYQIEANEAYYRWVLESIGVDLDDFEDE